MILSAPRRRWNPGCTFTKIPNSLFDDWAKILDPKEFLIQSILFRFTWGYNKPLDSIARSQICEMTGISPRTVDRVLAKLKGYGLIRVTGSTTRARIYEPTTIRNPKIRVATAMANQIYSALPPDGEPASPQLWQTPKKKEKGPRLVK